MIFSMSRQKDFYKRLTELEILLKKTQSNTSRELLQKAIELTKSTFSRCELISGLAAERIVFYNNAKKKFDQGLSQMNEATSQIKAAAANELYSYDTKSKILAAAEAMTKDIQHQYDIQAEANRQLRTSIEQCNLDLRNTLLKFIYKPNSSSFIADSVISILGRVVTGLIPYSDKVELVLEGFTNRKKKYLSDGDKLLSYLEDYITVLGAWSQLNDQFEIQVLND